MPVFAEFDLLIASLEAGAPFLRYADGAARPVRLLLDRARNALLWCDESAAAAATPIAAAMAAVAAGQIFSLSTVRCVP